MSADDIPFDDENGDPRKVPGTPREPSKVGYKNPPKHTQYKPGHSGNPTGRRRRPRTLAAAVLAALDKTMQIAEGGVHKTLSKREILALRIVNDALKGGIGQLKVLVQLCTEARNSTATDEMDVQADDLRLLAKYAPHLLSQAERNALDPLVSKSRRKTPARRRKTAGKKK